MVKAILDGRKTMTRRVVKPQPIAGGVDEMPLVQISGGKLAAVQKGKCPYGQVGDRLWVRETWYCDDYTTAQDIMSRGEGLYYRAAEKHPEIFYKWKPSVFMPRWASRITLEIIDVRVERLQDITEEDAIKEGVTLTGETFYESFFRLWNKINGKKYPWASNPWVWCISFKRV